ncbi:hypothetical protein [Desulfocucumis palustris]|uniref:hypothetical protein n=1 Tax=Desulfocucumis palustris TaxID=1898651 RepID=UPI000CE9D30E|nr:hypothetical protein [Desulfocucumis palustris]
MATLQEQQDILVATLSFYNKLLNSDTTVTTEIKTLNSTELPDDGKQQICGTLQDAINNATADKVSFLQTVISGLNFIDTAYYLGILSLTMLDVTDLATLKSTVQTELNKDVYAFSTDYNTFDYYKRLSMLAISARDSVLIEKAIIKVQSLSLGV